MIYVLIGGLGLVLFGLGFVCGQFKLFDHSDHSRRSTQLFAELNKLLATTNTTDDLLTHSSQIIASHLRVSRCRIQLHHQHTPHDVLRLAAKVPQTVIITDQLTKRYSRLRGKLQDQHITALVRLTSNIRGNQDGLGYILLGSKIGAPYKPADIALLESVAKELTIALQNAIRLEEIENFNATLQAKVTEATHKLRRSNEKLKQLDQAKDDFVSMASHQLRTPLTSIKGYTSMVLEGDAGKINATQRQLLEQSYTSAQRMVYLIADLLNVSRLKTGKFVIEPTAVNMAEVVEQEIGQLKATAASRSLELTYEMPADFPSLQLDETKTRQVIMNFIDNAIYYTPAGGHITVSLTQTPASVEFKVTDDGIGVPKLEQPHLFTKFYRAGNARTARPDGTGLGLFMAKKVIVAQGGAILFKTEEGKGSSFGFVFSKSPSVDKK